MTATIGEIAGNSEKARRITEEATRQAARISEQMNQLGAGGAGDRQGHRNHHRDLVADQPAGAQRHHRGGPRRFGRQGICRGRQRDQGTGAADRRRHRRHQGQDRGRAVLDRRRHRRNREGLAGDSRSQRHRIFHRRGHRGTVHGDQGHRPQHRARHRPVCGTPTSACPRPRRPPRRSPGKSSVSIRRPARWRTAANRSESSATELSRVAEQLQTTVQRFQV